jgi:hypothetical protein
VVPHGMAKRKDLARVDSGVCAVDFAESAQRVVGNTVVVLQRERASRTPHSPCSAPAAKASIHEPSRPELSSVDRSRHSERFDDLFCRRLVFAPRMDMWRRLVSSLRTILSQEERCRRSLGRPLGTLSLSAVRS